MLRQAHEKDCFEVSMAHAENLPFATESFERILIVDALHHFCNQEQAIADMVRVLKPGGRLVIEEPDLNHFSVKMIAVAEKVALMRSHFNYPLEIKAMLISHGLSVNIEVDETITAWIVADK
jgi:demethylmenaquinone methyltransferase/2-methoxy-6-polyprenyl-1,4-benzoquinol methylase